ncbi:MAG: hypothetical protein H2174_09865 [Vampirovibrio sp.]|nr:hypothetical protein [Vampirovibrio sp.]
MITTASTIQPFMPLNSIKLATAKKIPTDSEAVPTEKTPLATTEALPKTSVSNELLLASNNIQVTKLKTFSTAAGYRSWGLDIKKGKKGKDELWLKKKGQKPSLVKTGSHEELVAIKSLFKPKGVNSYTTKQQANGDCAILAPMQEMMLTGNVKNLIQAVSYNKHTKGFNVALYDDNGGRVTYPISKAQIMQYAKETKTVVGSDGKSQEGYTIPTSSHRNLTVAINLAMRQHSNDVMPEHKDKNPLSSENINGNWPQFLPNSLSPTTRKLATFYSKTSKSGLEKTSVQNFSAPTWNVSSDNKPLPLNLNELAKLRKAHPNQTITVFIASNYQEIPQALNNQGIVGTHAYTLLAVNEKKKTVTVINPWDSSKAIVLDAKSLFFNTVTVAKNKNNDTPTDSDMIA